MECFEILCDLAGIWQETFQIAWVILLEFFDCLLSFIGLGSG